MCEFPPGFDYETLVTDEDRELRKLALPSIPRMRQNTSVRNMRLFHSHLMTRNFVPIGQNMCVRSGN